MLDFRELTTRLADALNGPLPGRQAQLKMTSLKRGLETEGDHKGIPSSVLILFYLKEGNICIPFIKRPKYEGVHSGQIAFPGGRFEIEDMNLQNTALRETEEEIGIDRNKVKVLGGLTSLYIPPSNFKVSPVVGYYTENPRFSIDRNEVDHLLEIPVEELLDEKHRTRRIIDTSYGKIEVPCYFIQDEIIWGATAMMLSELLEILRGIINKN